MKKKYELEIEAKDFYGYQTFACEAESELEARDMFRRGMCEIIDVQIEVLGLEHEPMNIIESDDISSRLPQDLMARLTEENKRLLAALCYMRDSIMGLQDFIESKFGETK
jgi:hypothetical protein